jgi:hypothetical protein
MRGELRTADCGLRIAERGWRSANCGARIAERGLGREKTGDRQIRLAEFPLLTDGAGVCRLYVLWGPE